MRDDSKKETKPKPVNWPSLEKKLINKGVTPPSDSNSKKKTKNK